MFLALWKPVVIICLTFYLFVSLSISNLPLPKWNLTTFRNCVYNDAGLHGQTLISSFLIVFSLQFIFTNGNPWFVSLGLPHFLVLFFHNDWYLMSQKKIMFIESIQNFKTEYRTVFLVSYPYLQVHSFSQSYGIYFSLISKYQTISISLISYGKQLWR